MKKNEKRVDGVDLEGRMEMVPTTKRVFTFQSIFHVLSKESPHDLSADFTHVEFLRKSKRVGKKQLNVDTSRGEQLK